MKDLIIPVNNEALSRALLMVVGEQNTKVIVEAYRLIDAAMVFGYEKSQNEEADKRKTQAEEYVSALERADKRVASGSFNEGYDAGYKDANEACTEYDDGYVDGVADARAFPQFADEQVALLCAGEEYYEGDSGDENDYDFWPEADYWDDYFHNIDEDGEAKVNAAVEGADWRDLKDTF